MFSDTQWFLRLKPLDYPTRRVSAEWQPVPALHRPVLAVLRHSELFGCASRAAIPAATASSRYDERQMTLPDTSFKALEAPTDNRQIRGAIATLAVGAFTVLLAISFHGLVGVAGVGAAILALSVRGLARTRRFRWWQIALIVLGTFAAAALVMLLVLVAIVLIRSRH